MDSLFERGVEECRTWWEVCSVSLAFSFLALFHSVFCHSSTSSTLALQGSLRAIYSCYLFLQPPLTLTGDLEILMLLPQSPPPIFVSQKAFEIFHAWTASLMLASLQKKKHKNNLFFLSFNNILKGRRAKYVVREPSWTRSLLYS